MRKNAYDALYAFFQFQPSPSSERIWSSSVEFHVQALMSYDLEIARLCIIEGTQTRPERSVLIEWAGVFERATRTTQRHIRALQSEKGTRSWSGFPSDDVVVVKEAVSFPKRRGL